VRKMALAIILIAILCSVACARMPQIGDHVSIYSGYFTATLEGTITDIGNGLICIRESGKDWEGNDIEFNRCIGIGSICTLTWPDEFK